MKKKNRKAENPFHLRTICLLCCALQNFLVCQLCKSSCELFHKMAHQKYLMFIDCSRKVAEKNSENPMNGSTDILNELLADEEWLAQV